MTRKIAANASPEKRLFVSLITRDISLVAAFLDLIDNSINAAVEPLSKRLKSAVDFLNVFQDETLTPKVDIHLVLDGNRVEITDNASGISAKTASEEVFRFGKSSSDLHTGDRLSVYGIGLKRAIFKLGNLISIRSDHVRGGFDMNLNVEKWAAISHQPWTFEISERAPCGAAQTGTKIVVRDLLDDSKRRLADGVFLGQLKEAIARTYTFYLAKFVNIYVNGEQITSTGIEIGQNHASEIFEDSGVSGAITAGIGAPDGSGFRDRASGWFVFCNGRAVLSADKSALTGWGSGGLPIFQPKHRPFLGTVFFVSTDPEKLPWTTSKSGINEDSAIWQTAKRYMGTVGRVVVSYLDSRYTDEGSDVASRDLQEAAGDRVSVISAAASKARKFDPPKRSPAATTKIQYDARIDDVKRIARYLGQPSMGGSEVGRHTFQFFLRNEVGEK